MRFPRRSLTIVSILAATLVVFAVAPAAGQGTGVCSLVTRAEARELLGAKVVKTKKDTSAITGAQECTYQTKKVQKEFKDRGLKMQLEVAVQPVDEELRAELQEIPTDDGDVVEGLGDEAYATKFDEVIAVSGTTAVSTKLQNYSGPPTKFRSVSEGAVRTALTRLDRVTVSEPS